MTAPDVRLIDQFSGQKFWDAQREADDLVRELARLRDIEDNYGELQVRVAELGAENLDLKAKLARAITERDTARAERDNARAAATYVGRRGW